MKKIFKVVKHTTKRNGKDLVSCESHGSGEFYFDPDCRWMPKPIGF